MGLTCTRVRVQPKPSDSKENAPVKQTHSFTEVEVREFEKHFKVKHNSNCFYFDDILYMLMYYT